jgi:hypothetical protein
MVVTASGLLREQYADSCARLDRILAGLEDPEFFWEPVAGCWTLHRRDQPGAAAHADGSGEWVIDYELPEPQPAPFTTIAWRTVHIAAVNHLYWDYAFGAATAPYDLEFPGSAREAIAWLRETQQPILESLVALTDADLAEPRRTNWGELWPTERIARTLVHEQVHHGAEISLLRDLYRCRAAFPPPS